MGISHLQAMAMLGVPMLLAVSVAGEAASVVPYVFSERAAGNNGQLLFNDEGTTNGAVVFYNRVTDRAGINIADPQEKLDIGGTMEAQYYVGADGPVTMSDSSLWNSYNLLDSFFVPHDNLTVGIDVAIQGNGCIGVDCTTGMVFDDDLVLRENNLRITFYDSSPGAADWQLTANDRINGGQNYLGITEIDPNPAMPFQVQAPAVAHSLIIQEMTGNVGIHTPEPHSALQLSGYAQLASTTGRPPASDCDSSTERGRIIMDDSDVILWVCVDIGWMAK